MASRFAALVDSDAGSASDQEPSQPRADDVGAGPVAAARQGGEDDDDEGFLDAFFHNHRPARHIGAAAARQAAAAAWRRRGEAVEEANAQREAGGHRDEDRDAEEKEEEEEDEDLDESLQELQAGVDDVSLDCPKKRVSKKAARKAQRKLEKAGKHRPSGERAPDDAAEQPGAAASEPQAAPALALVAAPGGEDAGGKDEEGEAEAEEGFAKKEVCKAEAKRQKELERQQRRGQRRAEEAAEAEQIASEAGGVLDAKFRRRFLGCPTEIAPMQGRRHVWEISQGFVPGMRAPARFFADERLAMLCLEEISHAGGGFLPAVRQLANVATLPGLMGCSLGMPDIHSGYGFAVGSVAAIDLTDPEAVVSPGGVGFDINCGVRLLRTELTEDDVKGRRCAELATAIFDAVPSGVGAEGAFAPKGQQELRSALRDGMRWALQRGLCWKEDLERTEEGGAMPDADPDAVSARALKRGSPQLGTLGSGNHYLELQVVDEIFDAAAAKSMGLEQGKICVMIHCGSRGLGHQLCTDYLQTMEATMKKQGISVPDRQLCCVRASSPQGEQYLRGMAAAANYAFVNRTIIAHSVREVFRRVLGKDPRDGLQMHMVYDVAHNIAKREEHVDPADGQRKPALVHRKGATRSFPAGHPALPEVYRGVGQPVLIGGSMGTCSYVLAGNPEAMELSFGSTCHGAGRQMSRAESKRSISSQAVLAKLRSQGIEVRVASPKLVAEEADESYKDVTSVVRTCHDVGISRLVARLRPLAVIKG